MHGRPLEDGGEENGQSSPIVLAEGEEMEGTGDKVEVAELENCQQWERREGGGRERMCILSSRKTAEMKFGGGGNQDRRLEEGQEGRMEGESQEVSIKAVAEITQMEEISRA